MFSILKSTRDPKGTLRIIGLLLFMTRERGDMPLIQHLLGLERGNLESLLYDVHSIIDVDIKRHSIQIVHASLIDFFVDHSRSGDYFLDSKDVHADIAQMCFRVLFPDAVVDGAHQSSQYASQYALNFWYHHLQNAAPTQELLNFLNKCASEEAALDYTDKLKRNMRHWLGKLNVQALILSWLKKNDIQNTCLELYLHYRTLFDCEIASIVNQSPSPERLIMWIAMLPEISAYPAVYPMTQALATVFEMPAEDGEPNSIIPLRDCLVSLFEAGMGSHPHLFGEFFSDSIRSRKCFIGCDVHTKITLLLLRHIDKCISEPVLDDGLPDAAAWHWESLRQHLHSLKWWRHWSFHLSQSSPSSDELGKFLQRFSPNSFRPVMEVHDGVDFGHFHGHLSTHDMQKSVTHYLLRNAQYCEDNILSSKDTCVSVKSQSWFNMSTIFELLSFRSWSRLRKAE